MTDTEVIRKQAERILELEEAEKILRKGLIDLSRSYSERNVELNNAEIRCTDSARKLKAIEDEVNSYQFDSVTNLQNKIKTILMSSDEESAKHQD